MKMIDDKTLKSKYDNTFKSAVIIDVREPDEYIREHIQGSKNIPLSKITAHDFSKYRDGVVLFHCRSGNRTRISQNVFSSLNLKEMYCLEGGIEQWKRCKLPVETNHNAPIELMRQVQIAAGLLILIGVLLATLINFYFILLAAFVGAGLLFAGISGYCGMAKLLQHLPWNKRK